jgi:hypothetical protein
MTAFRRHSAGSLPDFIRMTADGQGASRRRKHPVRASGSRPPSLMRIRRATRAATIRACFFGASLVLAGTRLLRITGLLKSADAATAFRWSSRLTALAMRLWRQGRSPTPAITAALLERRYIPTPHRHHPSRTTRAL